MKLPSRAATHITETESWKILTAKAPSSWVIRELSERDYGIDAYIEICSAADEVTGNLFLAQIKGTETPLEWKDGTCLYSGIKIETVNYWMRLPVPVFLLVADCITKRIFFVDAKDCVRRAYDKFLGQKSFGFKLIELCELGTGDSAELFRILYVLAREFSNLENKVVTVLSHWKTYLSFIDGNTGLDGFMEVDEQDEIHFIEIYQLCDFLAALTKTKWELPSLNDLYAKDRAFWKDPYATIHYSTLTEIASKLRAALLDVVHKALVMVTKNQNSFWEHNHPAIARFCQNLVTNPDSFPDLFPKRERRKPPTENLLE